MARPSACHSAAGAWGRKSGPMTVVGSLGVLLLLVVATEAGIGSGFGKAAEGIGSGIGKGAKGAGSGFGKAAKGTGSGVGKGASGVGKGVGAAANAVGTGVGSAADPNVKVTMRNEASERVRMVIGGGKGKVLECKQRGVAVLGPLYMSEAKGHVLKVVVSAHNSKGRLRTNKAIVLLDLRVVAKLVAGVRHVLVVFKVNPRTKALVLTDAHSNVLVTLQYLKP